MTDDPETWRFSWETWPQSKLRILEEKTGEERFALKRRELGKLLGVFGLMLAITAGGSVSAWAAVQQGWIGYPCFFSLAGAAGLGGLVTGFLLEPISPLLISTDPEGREPLLYVMREFAFSDASCRMLDPNGQERGRLRTKGRSWSSKPDWRVIHPDGREILLAVEQSRFLAFSCTYVLSTPGSEGKRVGYLESDKKGGWILSLDAGLLDPGRAAALGALLISGISFRKF